MKLKHVDEGYLKHLINAIVFSAASVFAGTILLIHAIFPFVFQKTGSKILLWILKKNASRLSNLNSHIQIRYNTKSMDEKMPWRVIINGNERLAQDIFIIGSAYGEKTYVENVAKYNLATNGTAIWNNNSVTIVSEEK